VFLTVMVTVPRWTPQSGTSATEPGPLACRSGGGAAAGEGRRRHRPSAPSPGVASTGCPVWTSSVRNAERRARPWSCRRMSKL